VNAEEAMQKIEEHLERWFNGEQTQQQAMAAICIISGMYKMEAAR